MAGAVAIPNLAGALTNPVEAVGAALANAPVAAADQNAALEQKGWATIAPLITAAARNPALMQNSAFTNQLQRTAQMFRINGPLLDQAIQQTRAQLGGSGSMMKPGGQAQPSGGAQQTGPAQPQAQQPSQPPTTQTSTPGVATDKQGHPDLVNMYQQDLDWYAKNAHQLSKDNPVTKQFTQKAMLDGSRLRKTPQQIAHDLAAAAGAAGNGHPDDAANHPQGAAGAAQSDGQSGTGGAPLGSPQAGATGPAGSPNWTGPHALPPAMQGLMAAAGVAPTGMQAFGSTPISPSDLKLISESKPADRPMLLAGMGIDPSTAPTDWLNSPQQMTEAQAGVEQNRMFTQIQTMVNKGEDPTHVIQTAVLSGAITPAMAAAYQSDPNYLEPFRQAQERNLQSLATTGAIKGVQLKKLEAAVAAAPTMEALAKAEIQFLGAEIQNLPAVDASKVAESWATVSRLAAMTSEEQASAARQNQTTAGLSPNQYVSTLQKNYSDLNGAYKNLQTTLSKYIANDQDPSNVYVDGGDGSNGAPKLVDAVNQARTAADQAHTALTTALHNAAPNAAAGAATGAGYGVNGVPARPANLPASAQYGKLKNGHYGWGVPDGKGDFKTYDQHGNPVGP